MKYTLLLVEDDLEIIELLKLYLETDFTVIAASDGHEALKLVEKQDVDLAIVDVMLPGMDGFQWVKMIRRSFVFPVLFLSARGEESDKRLGLSLGADDYIAKPFNPLEVVARVKALLRRVHQFDQVQQEPVEVEAETIEAGELRLDKKSCTVYRQGKPVSLTSTEYKIFSLLIENKGRVMTRKRIYEAVWDDQFAYDDNTIMVHLSNLREKLEPNPKKPVYVTTIRGLGYKFDVPETH